MPPKRKKPHNAIDINERYRQIFEEHRFASEYRLKLLTSWGAVYVALAAVFAWMYKVSRPADWIVPLLGIFVTFLFWAGDARHKHAIGRSKSVGERLEKRLHDEEKFFRDLNYNISHTFVINVFAILMLILLILAVIWLVSNSGEMPGVTHELAHECENATRCSKPCCIE